LFINFYSLRLSDAALRHPIAFIVLASSFYLLDIESLVVSWLAIEKGFCTTLPNKNQRESEQ